jgi:type II secretion system protein G
MRSVTCLSCIGAIVITPTCLLMMIAASCGDYIEPDITRQVAAKVQIRNYLVALGSYKEDVGEFPPTEQGLEALRSNPGVLGWRGPYLEKEVAVDPWGHPYRYRATSGPPEIISSGADGKPVSSRTLDLPIRRRSHIRYGPFAIFAVGALGFFGYPLVLRRLPLGEQKPPLSDQITPRG